MPRLELYGGLPSTITVEGNSYPITTWFYNWIRFELLLQDKTVDLVEKIIAMRSYILDNNAEIEMTAEVIQQLVEFYHCGRTRTSQARQVATGRRDPLPAKREALYDFEQDMTAIYAAFRQAYNIDLAEEKLHWWKFMALLENIPDSTVLSNIFKIRGQSLKDMSKGARNKLLKIRKQWAVKPRSGVFKPVTVEREAGRDEAYKQRMQERAARK